jgi:hypothetical protein
MYRLTLKCYIPRGIYIKRKIIHNSSFTPQYLQLNFDLYYMFRPYLRPSSGTTFKSCWGRKLLYNKRVIIKLRPQFLPISFTLRSWGLSNLSLNKLKVYKIFLYNINIQLRILFILLSTFDYLMSYTPLHFYTTQLLREFSCCFLEIWLNISSVLIPLVTVVN